MPQYLRRLSRTSLACFFLTVLLTLCVSCAKGDMLLFATAEDCENAPVSSWTVTAPHAVVLQKASEKKQKTATQALKKAGVSDVSFLDFTAVKVANRSEKTLEKKWATDANTAKVASLLRRWKDDCIVYYYDNDDVDNRDPEDNSVSPSRSVLQKRRERRKLRNTLIEYNTQTRSYRTLNLPAAAYILPGQFRRRRSTEEC